MDVNVPIELPVTLRNATYSKDLGDSQMRKREVTILFLVPRENKYPYSQFGKFQYLGSNLSCRKDHSQKQLEYERESFLVGTSCPLYKRLP